MLVKVLAAIMFIITMSHMGSIVPADVFKKNVDNTRNRTMLTIVDDAIVNHFCNSGGHLPESLNDLMALGVKENLDNNFVYEVLDDSTYSLKIRGTNESSANSGRSLSSNVFNYSTDEKGNDVTMGTASTMWAAISYKTDSKGHIIGINSIECYAQYDDVGDDISDYYGGDFGDNSVDGSSWNLSNKLQKIFDGVSDLNTFARACGMDDIFDSTLPEIVIEDILESWGIYIWR